jgi:hypothetical protein
MAILSAQDSRDRTQLLMIQEWIEQVQIVSRIVQGRLQLSILHSREEHASQPRPLLRRLVGRVRHSQLQSADSRFLYDRAGVEQTASTTEMVNSQM